MDEGDSRQMSEEEAIVIVEGELIEENNTERDLEQSFAGHSALSRTRVFMSIAAGVQLLLFSGLLIFGERWDVDRIGLFRGYISSHLHADSGWFGLTPLSYLYIPNLIATVALAYYTLNTSIINARRDTSASMREDWTSASMEEDWKQYTIRDKILLCSSILPLFISVLYLLYHPAHQFSGEWIFGDDTILDKLFDTYDDDTHTNHIIRPFWLLLSVLALSVYGFALFKTNEQITDLWVSDDKITDLFPVTKIKAEETVSIDEAVRYGFETFKGIFKYVIVLIILGVITFLIMFASIKSGEPAIGLLAIPVYVIILILNFSLIVGIFYKFWVDILARSRK